MKKILCLLVLLGFVAAQEEGTIVSFRLKKDPSAPMRGRVIEFDDASFRLKHFDGKTSTIKWTELVGEDATKLRQRFKLERTEDERLGLIPGHEIFFKGGGSKRGVLLKHDPEEKRYFLRTDGLVLPYPEDRVERVEETKVKETEIYDENEIYLRRLENRPPTTAREHRDLAAHMYDIGNFRKSYEHFGEAIRMRPMWRTSLEGRLAEIKDILEDEDAAATYRKAKYEAFYNGRYRRGISMIENYIKHHPGAKRRGVRVVDEIRKQRIEKLQARYHRVKSEEFDRSIRRYLARRQPTINEAMSWSTSQLKDEVEMRVRARLNLGQEEWDLFQQSKARGASHWATYWSGSFVMDPRAARGKSSKRSIRGNPDSWWGQYRDVNTRATWLKAYAAERLPELFEVVQIRHTDCERCGGTGRVKKMSLRGLKALGGGHEWMETCPRCFGARQDRAVAYK